MSGSTPELGLGTAVDADDTADYLTLTLANSLRTLDTTYNNVTGHNHSGAHQGGPITSIPAGAIPDGSITSAKIADGTITGADIANATITNAKLASDTARANLLTNGGFEIWQRGNGPFTTNGAYTSDYWSMLVGAGATFSVTRETAQIAPRSLNSARCAITAYGGSPCYLGQKLEFSNNLQTQPISTSFSIWCNTPNAVRVMIQYNGGNETYSAYHTGNSTFQTLTLTTTLGSAITRIDLYVIFTAACTAYIDNAMLVVGSVAADYAPLHPADDVARCQRYYEIVPWTELGNLGAGIVVGHAAKFVSKPVTPTVTLGSWTNTNCTTAIDRQFATGCRVTATVVASGGFESWGNLLVEANP